MRVLVWTTVATGVLCGSLAAQATDVSLTPTQLWAVPGGLEAAALFRAQAYLGDDSTDVSVSGRGGIGSGGEWRGDLRATGYFAMSAPQAVGAPQDFFGEARVMLHGGDVPGQTDLALLVATSAHVVYGSWGLVGTVEVGALKRDDVRGSSVGLQVLAWERVGGLEARIGAGFTRFPRRIPDPVTFQLDGATQQWEVLVGIRSVEGPIRWRLDGGYMRGAFDGAWGVGEVSLRLTEQARVVVGAGVVPPSPVLSADARNTLYVGLDVLLDLGGWTGR